MNMNMSMNKCAGMNMSMSPEEFNSKLKEAAVVHNIALIHRRISDPENYQKSIEFYEQALELYISCHDHYNSTKSLEGSPNEVAIHGTAPAVNLELKIAQTLQSIAKLHVKLDNESLAITAHEDAITLLVGGTTKAAPPSPTTVIADFTPSSDTFQVIPLTDHERTRIVATSLSALAQIYGAQEINNPDYNLSEEEDALRYYQEGLNFLKTLENPVSTTRIPALSNEKSQNPLTADKQDELNACASDAHQTPSTSTRYKIDLRKDILSTLLAMATIYKRRNMYGKAVQVYEQARDVHLLLNSDQKEQEMIESLLALAYEKNGDLQKALVCYQHVLKVRKIMFGVTSIQVGNLYASMSNLNRRMGDLAQSLGWNKRAISIYTQHCDKIQGAVNSKDLALKFQVHRHLIGNLQNQGGLYVQMNEVDKAICNYLTVIEKQVAFQGEEHPDVATTLNILGDLYMSKKEYSEAKASFDRALKLYRKYGVGNEDPDIVSTLQCLCKLEVVIGDESKKKAIRNHHGQQTENASSIPKAPADDSPPHHLPFRPPVSRESVRDMDDNAEENQYVKVVETNPSFDDDDAVSQITFITHQPEAPSVANQTYQTMEQKLESWSPAEYVFRAVDKIANATEEFAQELFSSPKEYCPTKSAHQKSERRRRAWANMQNELESLDEGYEVRQFHSRDSTPVPTGASSTMYIPKSLATALDHEHVVLHGNPSLEKSVSGMNSSQPSKVPETLRHDERVQEEKVSSPMIVLPYKPASLASASYQVTPQTPDESITNHSSIQRSFMNSDDSVAGTEATSVFGSLAGMKFINDGSVAGTVDLARQSSAILGKSGSNRSTPLRDDILKHEDDAGSSTEIDMDTMLAQMNVVTCEMEGGAKPFEEVLKGESSYGPQRVRSKTKQNKTFEKLSSCLGMLDTLMDKYGPDHGKVIQMQSNLAALYLENKNDEKGVKKYHQVLQLQYKKYGNNSTQVAETNVKLGQHWVKKKDTEKAINSFSRAKEIDTFLFGKHHPQIAQHLNSMGMAELKSNHFDAAMDYLQSALQIQQMHLAPNEINPDVSLTYVNIGAVYYKERNSLEKNRSNSDGYKNFIQSGMLGKIAFAHSERGEYVDAMHFYGEVLELQKSTCDPIHRLAATYNCLGELNVKAGRYTEALDHHSKALEAIESSTNANELDICNTKCDLGVVYYHLGDFKQGASVLERACSVQCEVLGNNHNRVARTMYHMAVIKRILYDTKQSLHLLNKAVKIQLSTIGQYNPDTISTQIEIAKALLDLDQIDEAIKQFERVFGVQRSILGDAHPDLVETLHYVGICYARSNDETKAMSYFERCYRMQLKVCKFDSPFVASVKDEIGLALLKQGKNEKAFHAFQDSLRIRREVNEDHYEVAYSIFHIGLYFTSKRKYTDALKCFKDAMRIAVVAFGLNHPFIGEIHAGVGNVNTRKCHFDEAKSEFTLALQIYDKCRVPTSHWRVTKCEADLKRVQHEETLCV